MTSGGSRSDTAYEVQVPGGVASLNVSVTEKYNSSTGQAKGGGSAEEDEESIDTMVGYITVETKSKKGSKLMDHAVYRFDGDTLVYDQHGARSDIRDLKVPCKARIYYYPNDRKAPFLYRIDALSTGNKASRDWSVPPME